MTVNISNMAVTWDGGALFTAIKMNVTDLNSNGNSLFIDLQLNGVSKFRIGKDGTLNQGSAFAYLGQFNSQAYPDTSIGAAFSWNFTGGAGEVDIWNTFAVASPTNDQAAFTFKQMSGTGAARDVATIYSGGRVNANLFTAGAFTGQVTQLELQETLASSSGVGQVRFDRTEANTHGGEEAQIYLGYHRTGGSGQRVQVQSQIDTTVGGAGQYLVGWNGLAYAKKTGPAYATAAFAGIFATQVDAALPNVEAVALELDLICLGNVDRKVGLQVVDETTSVGQGTLSYDAGIMVGKQAGGRGFNYALQFGYDLTGAASEINNAFLYCPTGTIPDGIDFAGVTFSGNAFKAKGIKIAGTGNSTAVASIQGAGGTQQQIVGADGVQTYLELRAFGASAGLQYAAANGSAAAPSKVLNGARITRQAWHGYHGGGAYNQGARLTVTPTEDWNDATHTGTKVEWEVCPNASGTSKVVLGLGNGAYVGAVTDLGSGILNVENRVNTPWLSGGIAAASPLLLDGQPIFLPGSVTPATLATNGQFTLTPTSNTNFRISFRGTDGTTRVANITLA